VNQVDSGISVIEIPPRDQAIPVTREPVTAFIGPAPRGPADIPVAVRSLEEFLARFGVPGYLSRMEFLLYQYFENGGTLAVVVRVCRSRRRNRIRLPGAAGELVLEAVNPGPLEHLRACVDYEGVAAADPYRFNLVIHRCRSPEHPLVEEQETFAGISVRPGDTDYLADAVAGSRLVRLCGAPPAARPGRTLDPDAGYGVRYVYSEPDAAAGGADNMPTDYDLIGSRDQGTGLFALEQVPAVDFACLVPGVSGTPLGPVALFAADRYCRERHAILLVDPPAAWATTADVARTQRERGFASPNALTYFPALESPPHVATGGGLSAAGAIAGALCGAGLAPPRRVPLTLGRSRPTLDLDEMDIHQLGRLGVNALARPAPSRVELAALVTMARSLGVAVSWNDLVQRRVFLFVTGSIARHTRWAAFEGGGPATWQDVRSQCAEFLGALRARGLLAGSTPREAYYVKCDADTNAGPAGGSRLTFVVGVALARPGDFVAFQVSHTDESCAVAELGWQPGLALAG
jgi:hypothetical protein